MRRLPAQAWDRPLHRVRIPSLKTCDPFLPYGRQFFPTDPLHRTTRMREMKLQDLKIKTPAELVSLAEQRAGDGEIAPIDLFEALRAEGGSLAAEILRRAQEARNTASAPE